MKNYEIGSDFYFTPEKLNKINLIKLKLNSNEYKLENDEISKNILKRDKSTKQVLLGRNAINLVLLDLLENLENKKALIPAYTCETVIQPFLDNGFEIFYYHPGTTSRRGSRLLPQASRLLQCECECECEEKER